MQHAEREEQCIESDVSRLPHEVGERAPGRPEAVLDQETGVLQKIWRNQVRFREQQISNDHVSISDYFRLKKNIVGFPTPERPLCSIELHVHRAKQFSYRPLFPSAVR